jgi:diaminopimelate epimerase
MKKKLPFFKMSAAGNDFVLIKKMAKIKPKSLAITFCDRREGVGADGLLLVYREPRLGFDYYNADGSFAFCGNGMRAAAWWMSQRNWTRGKKEFELKTPLGVLSARIISPERVSVQMPKASGARLNVPIAVSGRPIKVHVIDTGVPHAVLPVKNLEKFDVNSWGSKIRNHPFFHPRGTNADFIEIKSGKIYIRTFERGVEAETLACGTGVVASAIISYLLGKSGNSAQVVARGGKLSVSFKRDVSGAIKDIRLEGPAKIVYSGEITL